MDMDPNQRPQVSFSMDRPLDALKQQHQFIKKMFDRYLNTQDVNVKRQAGPQILEQLEMHTALEEATFYPAVDKVDASLVDECEDEHQQAKQMISQLKGMQPGDPQCDRMYQQLCDAIMHHVQVEEQQLFPKVEQSGIDMARLGTQMQMFESNMVSAQAQRTERRDVTRP